ncbi:GNAT family N-acetyltransferase [Rheinheimera baltica]|uniref:lysophospholipid acyltransferase family protein n=2 Tax=Rheinheimera baltica TaxID=67576 RepID=UPI00273FEACC|nr:GNAT family N-acyltransferase [Rheinheimera baltica]MDP5142891.1 GNAT family N-acetyltransferase [Rheinheimera baltica]
MISAFSFLPEPWPSWLKRSVAFVIDRVTAIHRLNQRYQTQGFAGLSPEQFTRQFIAQFNLQISCQMPALPTNGPLIIVANHPFGGLEGVVMAHLLAQQRSDVKILANRMLGIFTELSDYFIYTNPLKAGASGNLSSLKTALAHLKTGGTLLVFPAGRVSYPQGTDNAVLDHRWHRSVAMLAKQSQAPIISCFISGQNRPGFYLAGKLWYRLRMILLVRELLVSNHKSFSVTFSQPIQELLPVADHHNTDLLQLVTYLQDPAYQQHWPTEESQPEQALAPAQAKATLSAELAALPEGQKLAQFKHYSSYYCSQAQCPSVVEEIRLLREANFRLLDEGSGKAQDGDQFDQSYTHLLVFDHQAERIIGAYRMGQTDNLLQQSGIAGLYLSRMFDFSSQFINQQQPCLEMGRSFIVADQQRSFHGLLLLFRGIAAFVSQFPRYRVLYGTVSLSRQYTPLSVSLIQKFLTQPDANVRAKLPFSHPVHPALAEYLARQPRDIDSLDWLVRQIEPDGKGVPVLVRQYHQLGARFYCVGIDPNFAATPGLLLSVDISQAPEKLQKLFFADLLPVYKQRVSDAALLQGAPST